MSYYGVGGYPSYAGQIQQLENLFNTIANGNSSITKSELEQTVTADGGTTQGADALYASLDPNNTGSVTETQFLNNLRGPLFSGPLGYQLLAAQAQGSAGTAGNGLNQIAQNLFGQVDTNGDGSITQADLEQAVTAAGGTTQGADALYAQLDPNNTGSVSEQTLAQYLQSQFNNSAQGALAALIQAPTGNGPTNAPSQVAQQLFSQIDTNGDGSISQSELEQAVTAAGGTIQAADALYAQLDPNNTGSVSEQTFAQALQPPSPTGNSSQDAIASLLQAAASSGAAAGSPAQLAQTLFSQIDTNGDGSITQSELEQAVTAAGGTTQAADALYAQLDPNNTGSVSEQTFAQSLQPPSPSGNTAQDALASLLQPANASTTGTSAFAQLAQTLFSQIDTNGDGSISQSELEQAVTAAGGTTQAADALYAKLDPNNTNGVTEQELAQALSTLAPHHHHHHHHSAGASNSANGSSAQDPLDALLQAVGGPATSASAQAAQSLFSQIDTSLEFHGTELT
jgi:Ca2+-binding EF-hand superfamily protein